MIPDHITPAQLTAGLAAMGLDAGEVISLSYDSTYGWVNAHLCLTGSPAPVEYTLAKIPVHDDPPEAQDLLGLAKEAQG